jgi:2-polyprenyl-3-methyl-5-hydroxy-6-metoxy-1,4-benzoquinol methylase
MAGMGSRIDEVWQRLAGSAIRLVPSPPALSLLEQARARIAQDLLARRSGDIAKAQALYGTDREGGRAAIGRVAEELVAELRAALLEEAPTTLTGLASRLDWYMPTDRQEHVDDPAFPEERRTASIRRLDALNRRLGSYVRFASALEPLLGEGPATVLDLASGHGGFAIALAKLARAEGRPLRVIASDVREEYVEIGRRQAEEEGIDVEFRVVDAFHIDRTFAPGEIDIITCTQTLHHFGAAATAGLVTEAVRAARRGIVFIDGVRSVSLLILLGALTWLASADKAFFDDATTSIRKAFAPEELALIARCAPGGERVEVSYLAPGFNLLRTRC